MAAIVIGVDPGLTTGLCALRYLVGPAAPIVVQIHGHEGVEPFVEALLARYGVDARRLLAVEAYVVGPRSARSSTPQAGKITRQLIGALSAFAETREVEHFTRPATVVKTWASDKRLEAAGLIAPTKGMQHARDAARHALYGAVHEGIARDPLSQAVAR